MGSAWVFIGSTGEGVVKRMAIWDCYRCEKTFEAPHVLWMEDRKSPLGEACPRCGGSGNPSEIVYPEGCLAVSHEFSVGFLHKAKKQRC